MAHVLGALQLRGCWSQKFVFTSSAI